MTDEIRVNGKRIMVYSDHSGSVAQTEWLNRWEGSYMSTTCESATDAITEATIAIRGSAERMHERTCQVIDEIYRELA